MAYTKQCPDCGNPMEYSAKYLYNRSVRKNSSCRSCSSKRNNDGRRITLFTRRCPQCKTELEYSVYHTWWWANKCNQVCRVCAHTGKPLSTRTKEKISSETIGSKNPMYGRHHTSAVKTFISQNNRGNKSKSGQTCDEDAKMNMRNAAIKRIQIQGTSRSYNPNACIFMDTMKPNYNFVHAANSGDEFQFRGYFADGYDKHKNIWFEYDEPYHYKNNGTLRRKDVARMNEIIRHLGCKFIRYDEAHKLLREYKIRT